MLPILHFKRNLFLKKKKTEHKAKKKKFYFFLRKGNYIVDIYIYIYIAWLYPVCLLPTKHRGRESEESYIVFVDPALAQSEDSSVNAPKWPPNPTVNEGSLVIAGQRHVLFLPLRKLTPEGEGHCHFHFSRVNKEV